jgi:hypothetical protein
LGANEALAEDEDLVWVQVSSHRDASDAVGVAQKYVKEFSNVTVFQTANGYFAVVLGMVKKSQAKGAIETLKAQGDVPEDTYATAGLRFTKLIWEGSETNRPSNAERSGGSALALKDGSIFLNGEIGTGFFEEFKELSGGASRNKLVILDSPGGNLAEAMRTGEFIRHKDMTVDVFGNCASACVPLALGGLHRNLMKNGRFGIHQTWWLGEQPDPSYVQKKMAGLADYYARMGADPTLVLEAADVPSSRIRWLTAREAQRFGLIRRD